MSSDYVKGLEDAAKAVEKVKTYSRAPMGFGGPLTAEQFRDRSLERIRALIPVSTQPPSLLCSICGRGEGYSTHDKNRHTDAWHPFSPPAPASPLTVPACVKCGHSGEVVKGRCTKSLALLAVDRIQGQDPCGCKCQFSTAQGDTAAEEKIGDYAKFYGACRDEQIEAQGDSAEETERNYMSMFSDTNVGDD